MIVCITTHLPSLPVIIMVQHMFERYDNHYTHYFNILTVTFTVKVWSSASHLKLIHAGPKALLQSFSTHLMAATIITQNHSRLRGAAVFMSLNPFQFNLNSELLNGIIFRDVLLKTQWYLK